MTNDRFDDLFGGPPHQSEERVTQRERDLVASFQAVAEEVVLRLTRVLARDTGAANLCLAVGNCLHRKAALKPSLEIDYKEVFEFD